MSNYQEGQTVKWIQNVFRGRKRKVVIRQGKVEKVFPNAVIVDYNGLRQGIPHVYMRSLDKAHELEALRSKM